MPEKIIPPFRNGTVPTFTLITVLYLPYCTVLYLRTYLHTFYSTWYVFKNTVRYTVIQTKFKVG
jgi:hypothetical protein